jgi:hypothetical protein
MWRNSGSDRRKDKCDNVCKRNGPRKRRPFRFLAIDSANLAFQAWESATNAITIGVCNIILIGTATRAVAATIRIDLIKH